MGARSLLRAALTTLLPLASSACGFFGLDYLTTGGPAMDGGTDGGVGDALAALPVDPAHLSQVGSISAAGANTCAFAAGGKVFCWGENAEGELCVSPDVTPSATKPRKLEGSFTGVGVGRQVVCVQKDDGPPSCCGADGYGGLGRGGGDCSNDFGPHPDLFPVAAADLVTAVGGQGYGMCGLSRAGAISCWGANDYAQAGVPTATTTCTATPARIATITDAVEIAVGYRHACARTKNGDVTCWGATADFGLASASATGDTSGPVQAQLGPGLPAASLTVGYQGGCVTTASGELDCWGNDDYGQTGVSNGEDVHRIDGLAGVVHAATIGGTDNAHTCAVLQTGRVMCFGSNAYGELGRGETDPNGAAPVAHPDPQPVLTAPGVPLENVSSVAAASGYSCGLTRDGHVFCWGRNDVGQLGDGTTDTRPFAVQVVAPF
jgi:alpha-tubulin suppressor-like RCC1 family protein